MRLAPLVLVALLAACTATLRVQTTPPEATAYLTDGPWRGEGPPTSYIASGRGGIRSAVPYFAWSDYHVWAHAPGYAPASVQLPVEPKIGPIVGGIFLWPLWMWAAGPTESSVQVDLVKLGDGLPEALNKPVGEAEAEK